MVRHLQNRAAMLDGLSMKPGLAVLMLAIWLGFGFLTTVHAESGPEAAARSAHEVLAEHCADVAAREANLVASSVVTVSAVWQEVGRQYEASSEPYLLYWRGVLAQCLGFDELATTDLGRFEEEEASSAAHAGLVQDARRRLRRLGTASRPTFPAPGAAQITVLSLLGSGGVFAGVSAARGEALRALDADSLATAQDQVQREDYLSRRDPIVEQTNLFAGLGIGCGVAALVTGVAAALSSSRRLTRGAAGPHLMPRLVVAPVDDGLALEGGLSWRW